MRQRRTPRLSLPDARDLFLLDCTARRLSAGTLQFYQSKWTVFFHWCSEHGIETLDALTAHDIHRRQLSSQYQNNLAIRAFLNYCVRDELLDTAPFARVQMPKLEKKIIAALAPAEIKRILQSCVYERDRTICLFLLDSGVRASELVALDVGDIDLQTGVVRVRMGKGQKGRTTYIGAKTRKQLKRYYAERGPVKPQEPAFCALLSGARLTVDGLVQLMVLAQVEVLFDHDHAGVALHQLVDQRNDLRRAAS